MAGLRAKVASAPWKVRQAIGENRRRRRRIGRLAAHPAARDAAVLDLRVAEEADGEIVALAPEVELSQARGPRSRGRFCSSQRHQLVLRGAHGVPRAWCAPASQGRVRDQSLSESQHRDEDGECAIADPENKQTCHLARRPGDRASDAKSRLRRPREYGRFRRLPRPRRAALARDRTIADNVYLATRGEISAEAGSLSPIFAGAELPQGTVATRAAYESFGISDNPGSELFSTRRSPSSTPRTRRAGACSATAPRAARARPRW